MSPLAMVGLMKGSCDYSDERDGEYHAGEQRDSLCVWQLAQRHQHRHILTIRRQVRPPHSSSLFFIILSFRDMELQNIRFFFVML